MKYVKTILTLLLLALPACQVLKPLAPSVAAVAAGRYLANADDQAAAASRLVGIAQVFELMGKGTIAPHPEALSEALGLHAGDDPDLNALVGDLAALYVAAYDDAPANQKAALKRLGVIAARVKSVAVRYLNDAAEATLEPPLPSLGK